MESVILEVNNLFQKIEHELVASEKGCFLVLDEFKPRLIKLFRSLEQCEESKKASIRNFKEIEIITKTKTVLEELIIFLLMEDVKIDDDLVFNHFFEKNKQNKMRFKPLIMLSRNKNIDLTKK